MFGWSNPEAQIAAWMSYDTEVQKNSLEEGDYEGMQDTDQEQPTIQLEMSDHIPNQERKWKDIIASGFSHTCGNLRSRNLTVNGYDMKIVGLKLRFTFQRDGSHEFTDRDGINYIWKGSNKTRFQFCQNSRNTLLCTRAMQGYTGGEMIEPETMGHVLILFKWKQFVFHRGCSFNLKSTLGAGLNAGERGGHESRHTVFFTPTPMEGRN